MLKLEDDAPKVKSGISENPVISRYNLAHSRPANVTSHESHLNHVTLVLKFCDQWNNKTKHVNTREQVADILTKFLDSEFLRTCTINLTIGG